MYKSKISIKTTLSWFCPVSSNHTIDKKPWEYWNKWVKALTFALTIQVSWKRRKRRRISVRYLKGILDPKIKCFSFYLNCQYQFRFGGKLEYPERHRENMQTLHRKALSQLGLNPWPSCCGVGVLTTVQNTFEKQQCVFPEIVSRLFKRIHRPLLWAVSWRSYFLSTQMLMDERLMLLTVRDVNIKVFSSAVMLANRKTR